MRYQSIFVALVMLASLNGVKAQAFEIGDNVLGVSLGVGGHYRAFNSYSSQTPAIGLSYERGVTDLGPGVLGIGGYIGYKAMSYRSHTGGWYGTPGYEYDYRWSYLIIGVRGAWHYNEWHGIPELDIYGGLMLSYNSVNYRDRTIYPSGVHPSYSYGGGSVGFTGFLGTRYFITPSLAAQLELGYGVSLLSFGIALKF